MATSRYGSQNSDNILPWRSIIAGACAGGAEISVTYPAEFAKTRAQLNRRLPDEQKLPWPRFGRAWYTGYTTLLIGSSVKAGIQFTAFDLYKRLLQNERGEVTGPMTMVAGFGAGITESALAVTPFESIKTTLIEDKKSPKPRGFLHGTTIILKERGLRGLFQGFVPTTARQASNAMVKFASYAKLKIWVESRLKPGEKLGTLGTFGIGSLTGIASVYSTQPLDVLKTRMQSIKAKTEYGNVLRCAVQIFKQEGITVFWSGAVPRMARLMLSGGIMFTIYEKMTLALNRIQLVQKTVREEDYHTSP